MAEKVMLRQKATGAQPAACASSNADITRRHFVRLSAAGTLALGTTVKTGCAAEQSSKASKEIAGYFEKNQISTQSCATCHFFIDPTDCIVVEGPVSPWGYCNYFTD